jgi:hypothetical protein
MQAIRSKDKLSPTGGCSLAYCPCVSIDACVVISALNQRAPDSICCTGNGGYSLDRAVVRRLICSLKRPSAPFRARQASNPEPEAALSDTIQHLAKMNNHDVRAPIFGVGREVAINRGISILPTITTNRNDLPELGRRRNRRFQFREPSFQRHLWIVSPSFRTRSSSSAVSMILANAWIAK